MLTWQKQQEKQEFPHITVNIRNGSMSQHVLITVKYFISLVEAMQEKNENNLFS